MPLGKFHVRHGHGIEIIVGESDEAESEAAKCDNLFHHDLGIALPWPLPIRAPHRAEGAVLRASPDCLHRGPHSTALAQQIPAAALEPRGIHSAALITL